MTLAATGHRTVGSKGRLGMAVTLEAKIMETRLDTHF